MSVPAGLITQQLTGAAANALIGSGITAARANFAQKFEANAVILFGGIAGDAPNSKLISAISGTLNPRFVPMVGASVVNNQVAQYPFANQSVAANAMIAQPLAFSMLMLVPAASMSEGGQTNSLLATAALGASTATYATSAGYTSKLAAMTNLISQLQQHCNLGGVFSVMTPSYIFKNCLLTGMYDVSSGQSQQVQYQWRLDFLQPLLTLEAAQQAQSTLMQKMTARAPIIGQPSWSGPSNGNVGGNAATQTAGLIAPSSVQ